MVTDGEETCGGSPCDVGEQLHASAEQLTVHIIGYRPKGFSWTGEESILGAKCLADANGGLYIAIAAETKEDLVEALDKTLGCPMVTRLTSPSYLDVVRLAAQGAPSPRSLGRQSSQAHPTKL